MSTPLVDFSFVYEMAEDDTTYVYEVVSLFLNTLSDGMIKLEQLITSEADYDEIRFQSHFLKSSAKVVKVRGMYEGFLELEELTREHTGREKLLPLFNSMKSIFLEARPELEKEVEKTQKVLSQN
jgi:hypothetical protein